MVESELGECAVRTKEREKETTNLWSKHATCYICCFANLMEYLKEESGRGEIVEKVNWVNEL